MPAKNFSMKVSVVVTLFNEEENIKPLLEQISNALSGYHYEVILVDDGSTDKTVENVKSFANEHVKLVLLQKNYGQTAAMSAGIEQAEGTYIVTMDGDLQNDPSDIPQMMKMLEDNDWDLVAGRRKNRKDGFILRKFPSLIANAIIRRLTNVKVSDYGCSLKIMKKDIAKNLELYGELHRFIPVLAQLQGARITNMDVKHHPRVHGKSKYGIGRTSRVVSDLLLMVFFQKYAKRPMHLFGGIGFLSFSIGSIICFYLLVVRILGHDIWGRPLLLLGITLVIGGIQMITFGILSEILMRTYFESQNKKIYRIKDIYFGQRTH